jgi:FtsP/CotA-like multicopper oxidase with cupredoxin domain
MRLPEAQDVNPDPHVVEVNLDARVADVEIAPQKKFQAWTYNGGIPGPLIRAHVGDRVVIHFSNHLPKPTTVHWHGLRIPNNMDGVPDVSQPDVQPGDSFTYDFVVPDAGLFWYHPHVMSAAQVGFGLYGAMLVEDPKEDAQIGVPSQSVMVLSDIDLTENGKLEDPETGGSAGMAFGREGNHLLVNGREGGRLMARPGVPQRWRIVNAAKSRYFELQIDDQHFTTIGVGGGLLEYPIQTETLVIAPGERRDVLFIPSAPPGSVLPVRAMLHNRGYGSIEARPPFDDLFQVSLTPDPPYTGPLPAPPHRFIEPLPVEGATQVAITLTIDQLADGKFQYGINGVPFAKDKPLVASVGETQVWTITNKTKWSHPFHLHGFFFQVLDENGKPARPLSWRDTINVPFESSAKFAVKFDDRPGAWMYHCHILDHADGGLMGMLEVGDVDPKRIVRHHHP